MALQRNFEEGTPSAGNGGAPRRRKGVLRSFREKKIGGVLRILRALNICNGLLLLILYPLGFVSNLISFDLTPPHIKHKKVYFSLDQ